MSAVESDSRRETVWCCPVCFITVVSGVVRSFTRLGAGFRMTKGVLQSQGIALCGSRSTLQNK